MFGGNINFPSNEATVDDIQAAMRPLAQFDDAQLRELLDNDVKTEEHISSIDLTTKKMIISKKDMTMAKNKSIAEYNLSLKPQLEAGKSNLKQLMQQIEEVRSCILQKQDKLNGSVQNAETTLALLQTSAAESEEHSENLADMFYQKEVEVDEFLDKFQESRKNMHLRRVKAEKMVEILSKKSNHPVSSQVRRAPPIPPYPMGPIMPYFNNVS